jgi:hypothetical protein
MISCDSALANTQYNRKTGFAERAANVLLYFTVFCATPPRMYAYIKYVRRRVTGTALVQHTEKK